MILPNTFSSEGPSFSLRNRFARVLWHFIWISLFRPTPPPMHSWRCWLLRLFGARIASGCHVYSQVRIWAPWNLSMAQKACLGPRVNCYSMAPIVLGERVVVSQGVHLCTGTHNYNLVSFPLVSEPIIIGSDAWICSEAFIGPGVEIGEGAVIGARSVVMKSQPCWMVCAGNPSRPLKPRIHPNRTNSSFADFS